MEETDLTSIKSKPNRVLFCARPALRQQFENWSGGDGIRTR